MGQTTKSEKRKNASAVVRSELSWLTDFLMLRFGLKADEARALIQQHLNLT